MSDRLVDADDSVALTDDIEHIALMPLVASERGTNMVLLQLAHFT